MCHGRPLFPNCLRRWFLRPTKAASVRILNAKPPPLPALPPVEVDDPGDSDLLVLGWGSTWGSIQAAVRRVRAGGKQVAHAHLVHMNPFPANLAEVLSGYRKILVPEMNLGQLSRLVRAEYLVDAQTLSKVQGVPFSATEIEARILEMLDA